MGKRRKAIKVKAAPTERNAPLATQFNCLFCNHEKSIIIKLDKKANVGTAKCNVCGTDFQTTINYLSAPVDVMSDWVDAADEVKKNGGERQRDDGDRRQNMMERPREADDFIVDDERGRGGGGGGGDDFDDDDDDDDDAFE